MTLIYQIIWKGNNAPGHKNMHIMSLKRLLRNIPSIEAHHAYGTFA